MPEIRDEFIIDRQGKKFALYAGLLEAGHNKGLNTVTTELVQVPSDENKNVAIVKAEVGEKDYETGQWKQGPFHGIGDASAQNVGRMIAPHLIRMAETRAKARALRDYVNVNVAIMEDDFDESSDGHREPPRGTTRAQEQRVRDEQPEIPGTEQPPDRPSTSEQHQIIRKEFMRIYGNKGGPIRLRRVLKSRNKEAVSDLTFAQAEAMIVWAEGRSAEGEEG